MPDNKTAASTGIEGGRTSTHGAAIVRHAPTARKWQRWLRAVLESPRTSRELEKPPVFDHVAHSTASEVRKFGVTVVTEMITVVGYAGHPARIARYSIAPESRDFAFRLLGDRP
jgi:hypothetical protein